MAILTKSGEGGKYVGESLGEFQKRKQFERIAKRGLTEKEKQAYGQDSETVEKVAKELQTLTVEEQQKAISKGYIEKTITEERPTTVQQPEIREYNVYDVEKQESRRVMGLEREALIQRLKQEQLYTPASQVKEEFNIKQNLQNKDYKKIYFTQEEDNQGEIKEVPVFLELNKEKQTQEKKEEPVKIDILKKGKEEFKKEPVEFIGGLVKGSVERAGEFTASLVKGTGKFLYAPNYVKTKPVINIEQDEILKSDNLLLDKDVQIVGIGGAFVVGSVIAPVATSLIGVGVAGQSVRNTLNPQLITEELASEQIGKGIFDIGLAFTGLKEGFFPKGKTQSIRDVKLIIEKGSTDKIKILTETGKIGDKDYKGFIVDNPKEIYAKYTIGKGIDNFPIEKEFIITKNKETGVVKVRELKETFTGNIKAIEKTEIPDALRLDIKQKKISKPSSEEKYNLISDIYTGTFIDYTQNTKVREQFTGELINIGKEIKPKIEVVKEPTKYSQYDIIKAGDIETQQNLFIDNLKQKKEFDIKGDIDFRSRQDVSGKISNVKETQYLSYLEFNKYQNELGIKKKTFGVSEARIPEIRFSNEPNVKDLLEISTIEKEGVRITKKREVKQPQEYLKGYQQQFVAGEFTLIPYQEGKQPSRYKLDLINEKQINKELKQLKQELNILEQGQQVKSKLKILEEEQLNIKQSQKELESEYGFAIMFNQEAKTTAKEPKETQVKKEIYNVNIGKALPKNKQQTISIETFDIGTVPIENNKPFINRLTPYKERPIRQISNYQKDKTSFYNVIKTNNKPEQKNVPELKNIIEQRNIPELKNITEKKNIPEQRNVSELKNISEQKNIPEQKNIQKQKNISEQKKISILKNKSNIFTSINRINMPQLKPFFFKKETTSQPKESKVKLFIKRKGRFERAGEFATSEKALARGKRILDITSSASLKITDDKGNLITPKADNRQFKESKKTKGVLIEQSEFRISTAGEIFQISKKGQEAQKKSKINFNL